MPDHTYKRIEVTGTSGIGSDDAIRNALAKAAQTVKNISWFEVVETRGQIRDAEITEWQVTVKLGFRLD